MYDKKKHLNFLMSPYKLGPKKCRSKKMIKLRRMIFSINSKTQKRGDFIQNKYSFRKKVSGKVLTPEIYYFGTNLIEIKKKMMQLDEFVMKPNHLSRGIGIRVLKRENDKFVDINGDVLSVDDLIDECKIIINKRRYGTTRAIILEKVIHSNKKFNCIGIADIRMIYYKKRIIFAVARIPSKKSMGYGNIVRGANWGAVIGGVYMSDDRFNHPTINHGKLPFWKEMVSAGETVTKLYGITFQAVDLTVDESGKVIVIESERMPQIEYYLSDQGVDWIQKVIKSNIKLPLIVNRKKITKRGISRYFPKNVKVRHVSMDKV